VDGLWFLIAIALLRFLWRFIERAARAEQPGPAEVVEEPTAREDRRARRTRAPRDRPVVGRRSEVPVDAPLEPGDLLERLRRAVEAASATRPEPSPRVPAAPPPAPTAPTVPRPTPAMLRSPTVSSPFEPPGSAAVKPAVAGRRSVRGQSESAVLRRDTARGRGFRVVLHHRSAVRDAILLREILGPPVSRRAASVPIRER